MNPDDLIGVVFQKKPLWDQKDPLHHHRYVLDKLWDEVATLMNSTRQTVRGKWKALRDKFRQELQKKPVPRSGDAGGTQADWKSPWKHFENLLFLQDQFTVRTAGGSLPEPEGTTSPLETEPPDGPAFFNADEDAFIAPRCLPESSETPGSSQRKRKRPHDEIGNALIRLEEKKLELFEKKSQQPTAVIDDDMAFFQSLLPHVKSLRQTDKLLLRIKMQQLVYDFIAPNPESGENSGIQPIHDQLERPSRPTAAAKVQFAHNARQAFSHPPQPRND